MKHTLAELKERQALPLDIKIAMTRTRIRAWVNEFGVNGVYISFSGGKDSTVLLDIARRDYPNLKAMFVNVPTQYPELKEFAMSFPNVDIVSPKIGFMEVCKKHGFPLISKEVAHKMSDWESAHRHGHESYVDRQMDGTFKTRNGKTNMVGMQRYAFLREAPFSISHKCCNIMKKDPCKKYEKETGRMPITAQMAEESLLRQQKWLNFGCNAFEASRPMSSPMSFWTEQDVLRYIKMNDLKICSVYGDVVSDDEEMGQIQLSDYGYTDFQRDMPLLHCTGCSRTGCVLCGFGAHMPDDDRFLKLKQTHPKMYALLDVIENNGYTMREAISWISEHSGKSIKL